MIKIAVDSEIAGMRLDRFIRQRLPLTSLGDIHRLFRTGAIRVNGKRAKQADRTAEGDQLELRIPDVEFSDGKKGTASTDLVKTRFFEKNFKIVYEDEDLLACNKPAGLVVHPGTGHVKNDTLIDLAISYIRNKGMDGDTEPALVHRLDRDTSGIILLARNKRTVRDLNDQLRRNSMNKRYVAICHGTPAKQRGTIELGLIRTDNRDSGSKMQVSDDGRLSRSRYSVMSTVGALCKVEVFLETGRTHQIRVHLAHIGCPIVGDVRYGNEQKDGLVFGNNPALRRLYLHACSVSLFHPALKKNCSFSAPEPEIFERLLQSGAPGKS